MATSVGTHDAKTHLSDYLNRVAYGGERIVVERHSKPVAALVSVEDLQKLEELDRHHDDEATDEEKEARFRESLRKAGVVVHWPSGKPVPREERQLIRVEGPPLSDDIIADRRERDRLLSGQ
jgi:prevent-host-death family protein